jgi:hypothetical protein
MHFNANGWHVSTSNVGAIAPAPEWDFAEGSTLSFFSEYLALQNPNGTPVTVDLNYATEQRQRATKTLTLPANSPTTVRVFTGDPTSNVTDCLPDDPAGTCGVGPNQVGVSVQVKSRSLPIVAERPFYVNHANPFGFSHPIADGHDAFGANGAALSWSFAEGTTLWDATAKQGFKEFLTLQNPGTTDAGVTLTYQLGAGPPPVKTLTVPAASRVTVEVFHGDTSSVTNCTPNQSATGPGTCGVGPGQVNVSVAVTSTQPIVAERPMYLDYDFGSGPVAGAHDAVGANQLATLFGFAWALTEAGDNDYLTIQNPGAADAHLTVTYYPPLGPSIVRTITVAGRSRHTVEVFGTTEGAGPGLSSLGIVVASDQPVLVEKPTYSANPTTYGATVTGGYSPTPGFF